MDSTGGDGGIVLGVDVLDLSDLSIPASHIPGESAESGGNGLFGDQIEVHVVLLDIEFGFALEFSFGSYEGSSEVVRLCESPGGVVVGSAFLANNNLANEFFYAGVSFGSIVPVIALYAVAEGVLVELIGEDKLEYLHSGIQLLRIVLKSLANSVHGALYAVLGNAGAEVTDHAGLVFVGSIVAVSRPSLLGVKTESGVGDSILSGGGSFGVDEAEVVPLAEDLELLIHFFVFEHGDNLGGAIGAADLYITVDVVESRIHAANCAAEENGIFVLGKGGFPVNEEVSHYVPVIDLLGELVAELLRDLNGIGEVVDDGIVFSVGNSIDAAIGSGAEIPDFLSQSIVNARVVLQDGSDVGKQTGSDSAVGLVVPGAGEVNVVLYAEFDFVEELVVGEIDVLYFYANLLAADLVESLNNKSVIDRSGAAGTAGPAKLNHFVLGHSAERKSHQDCQNESHEFLHNGNPPFLLLQRYFYRYNLGKRLSLYRADRKTGDKVLLEEGIGARNRDNSNHNHCHSYGFGRYFGAGVRAHKLTVTGQEVDVILKRDQNVLKRVLILSITVHVILGKHPVVPVGEGVEKTDGGDGRKRDRKNNLKENSDLLCAVNLGRFDDRIRHGGLEERSHDDDIERRAAHRENQRPIGISET